MRAVRMHDYGDPDVLRVDEIAAPGPPRDDELLVRTSASSINGTDLGLRRGGMKVATAGRLPFTLGFDLAGDVVACGDRVTAFGPGDRVAALLGHDGGAQAELVRVRQHRAARVPKGVSDIDAAAVTLAGLTALQALYGAGALARRSGARRATSPRVLVIGASGGIGADAVQLAALSGAEVMGLASAWKLDRVRSWGATTALDRHRTSATDLALQGERFDIVLDAHGGTRYSDLRPLLRESGTVVSTRPVSRDTWRAAGTMVPGRHRAAGHYGFVATRPRAADLARLLDLVDRGILVAPIDTVVPIAQVGRAHRLAQTTAAGKVVLQL